MPELSSEFLNFLRNTPEALANMTKVVKTFMEVHGEVPAGGADPKTPGPRAWEESEQHTLTTVGLAQEDIDKLIEASAEAEVVEKFLSWLKGFASGVMFVA